MPLILLPIIILYFVLVIWGTIFIVQRQTTSKRKWLFAVLLPVLFFIGPFADEFVARPYFYYLCESKGGLKVYETVKLDKSFFNGKGKLSFLLEAKNSREYLVNDRYKIVFGKTKNYNPILNIRILSINVNDVATRKIMAVHNMFLYEHGWLMTLLSKAMPTQSIKCHKILEIEINEIYESVFLKG